MKQRRKQPARKVADRIGTELDIDSFNSFLLQMDSLNELTVRGKAALRTCSENEMALDYADKSVNICGEGLKMLSFSDQECVIAGKVRQISFLWGGE